jgi:hypothetical protein
MQITLAVKIAIIVDFQMILLQLEVQSEQKVPLHLLEVGYRL